METEFKAEGGRDYEWQSSLSAPLKAFPNYSEWADGASAKTEEGYYLTMGFYAPKGDRYGHLYVEKYKNDDGSHYTVFEEGDVRTGQEAEALLVKWARKYGFKCPFDKQGRLF